mmetsp:Transcript_15572/g.27602  ORF Transcript_15572/g.27602 Transcript_15572/m.27602 type:complete len:216 (-) Transcript_15572:84-731(-)
MIKRPHAIHLLARLPSRLQQTLLVRYDSVPKLAALWEVHSRCVQRLLPNLAHHTHTLLRHLSFACVHGNDKPKEREPQLHRQVLRSRRLIQLHQQLLVLLHLLIVIAVLPFLAHTPFLQRRRLVLNPLLPHLQAQREELAQRLPRGAQPPRELHLPQQLNILLVQFELIRVRFQLFLDVHYRLLILRGRLHLHIAVTRVHWLRHLRCNIVGADSA